MRIQLGTNPIAWSNDDMPELGGETPLETCLAEAALAGFTGIELGNKFPRQPGPLRAALAPYGLACVSGWYSGELRNRTVEQEIEAATPHLDLLVAMGSPVFIYAETAGTVQGRRDVPVADRPVMDEAEWPVFLERLQKLAAYMKGKGIQLAFHHHMGTVIERAHEVDRMMEGTGPEVGLLFDTGHFTFAGDDPAAVAKRWAKRVVHVHGKDVRPEILERVRAERMSFLDAVVEGVYTVPGDGMVDFRAALAPIAAAGYSGWVICEAEQDPAKAHPLTYARKGHATLKAVTTGLGFEIV